MTNHGTRAGYTDGCRQQCCRAAESRYQAQRLLDAMNGRPRTIDATGTHRRIEALLALGWGYKAMADRLGYTREAIRQVHLHHTVYAATAKAIDGVFRDLCMTPPQPTTAHERAMVDRVRRTAERHGYVPPLAWDDIDNDDAPAQVEETNELDPVVVDRLLAGTPTEVPMSDRPAIVRELAAHGHSDQDIARLIGVWGETVLRIRQRHSIPAGVPVGSDQTIRKRVAA